MALRVREITLADASAERNRTPLQLFMRRFLRNRLAVLGVVLVLFMVAVALFARQLAPMNPHISFPDGTTAQGLPLPPTWNWHHFFLGTDSSGRDEMSQLLYGTQVSMEVGFMATLITLVIGVFIGMISGFLGGFWDNVLMRFTDIVLAFPQLLFIILLRSVIPNPTVATVYIVIGVLGWAGVARIARGQTLAARKMEYVDAARSLGSRNLRIVFMHIFPNIMSPVIVYATLLVANNIIFESALSFLGIGVPDPTVSWGKMINLGLSWYQTDPWLIVWPGVAIAIATLGFNLLGDGLNDAFNPRAGE
ncbi:MAG: ABC transporter permease [Thermaerobacter sp.]|nr:ABC transporter permease [Thermaerobacter sp.]